MFGTHSSLSCNCGTEAGCIEYCVRSQYCGPHKFQFVLRCTLLGATGGQKLAKVDSCVKQIAQHINCQELLKVSLTCYKDMPVILYKHQQQSRRQNQPCAYE